MAVDFSGETSGNFYVSNYYAGSVQAFTPPPPPYDNPPDPASGGASADAPCGLAIDSTDILYVNNYHRNVVRFPGGALAGSQFATGVAVDPANDDVYVDLRDRIAVYDSTGAPLLDDGSPLEIGAGAIEDGYGIAVSGFPATAGRIYVPDAGSDTVKAFDSSSGAPVQTIAGPPGGFGSLHDSAIAVDDATGEVYVLDTRGAGEYPLATVQVFAASGAFKGRLKHDAIDGRPAGLAVDNSGTAGQSRVYVTSGIGEASRIYAYGPGAATMASAPPQYPSTSTFIGQLSPSIAIGGETPPEPSPDIVCEGDSCQVLEPDPGDPTLTTLLEGLGNPRPRYRKLIGNCKALAREADELSREARKASRAAKHTADAKRAKRLRSRAGKLAKRSRGTERGARRCLAATGKGKGKGKARASSFSGAALPAGRASAPEASSSSTIPSSSLPASMEGPRTAALLPGTEGFSVKVRENDGTPAGLVGSHPYDLSLSFAAEAGQDLRDLEIEMPPGLLANLAAIPFCSGAQFANPRTPIHPGTSLSGENCPDRTQVGTIEVQTAIGGGQTRSFGLFNLTPANGFAARVGAYPFGSPGQPAAGEPLRFDTQVSLDSSGSYAQRLIATVPADLELRGLDLTLWGTPWHAAHNTERGDCLNEAEPGFAWAKCSIGPVKSNTPLAYLTLPSECRPTLAFGAGARTWQDSTFESTSAVNRDDGGNPVQLADCEGLAFEPNPVALLSTTQASTPSGFEFRLKNDVDRGLLDSHFRILSHARRAEVALPEGVTLNASLAAGLAICKSDEYAAETLSSSFGEGCPTESKIGEFRFRTPFYQGFLDGSIFLAEPDDKATEAPGSENPFDSLLAAYLVAKSVQRGFLIKLAGKIAPDPGSGDLTATFEGLPQFPYTDLVAKFKSGQRAPLATPDRCGDAGTKTKMSPWSGGASVTTPTPSEIETGPGGGPCPDPNAAAPAFNPQVGAGGVNSNVGSYTPYYVRIAREANEQQLTSYSLVLPEGITGKLAGVPFCPEASIEAARANGGFAETASPSCPQASQVGRTLTGYAVGSALTYAPGRVYLAGPYNGSPLSLVTVNSATVGSFDLGTIVIRSAFKVDPKTARLEIDSSASDPIPHIVEGFPLHLRTVRIYMDRFEFTHNPSSCEASELVSTLGGAGRRLGDPADDTTAEVRSHFQLLNCLTLGFKPKLGIRLRGPSRRGAYPSLRATFASRGAEDSNLKRIEVVMPHSEFLAQNHIRTVCTRRAFEAEQCPASSAYGHAVARTPLFDDPLRGNVYLRSSNTRLPDLVADLHAGAIRIVVEGRIGPTKQGGVDVFFDNLPDAPIESFTMTLFGGKRGLLQNSADVCKSPPLASVKALGQNDVGAVFTSVLRGRCGGSKG